MLTAWGCISSGTFQIRCCTKSGMQCQDKDTQIRTQDLLLRGWDFLTGKCGYIHLYTFGTNM